MEETKGQVIQGYGIQVELIVGIYHLMLPNGSKGFHQGVIRLLTYQVAEGGGGAVGDQVGGKPRENIGFCCEYCLMAGKAKGTHPVGVDPQKTKLLDKKRAKGGHFLICGNPISGSSLT